MVLLVLLVLTKRGQPRSNVTDPWDPTSLSLRALITFNSEQKLLIPLHLSCSGGYAFPFFYYTVL